MTERSTDQQPLSYSELRRHASKLEVEVKRLRERCSNQRRELKRLCAKQVTLIAVKQAQAAELKEWESCIPQPGSFPSVPPGPSVELDLSAVIIPPNLTSEPRKCSASCLLAPWHGGDCYTVRAGLVAEEEAAQ